MKTVNLEEILTENFGSSDVEGYRSAIIDAMREACEQTIDLCAENGTTELTSTCIRFDKQSVLNTKNQII